jgi:hypothetical protein
MLNATETAAQHPALQALWHKVGLWSDADKLRAIQDAAIQLVPAIANGEIFRSDACYVLREDARNIGLDFAHPRPAKRPQLSDLWQSGSLEQDADIVLLAFREAYYRDEPISNEELDAKAVANEVACPSAQGALEIASEPTQLLHCGSPRNARAAEGVTP